jgi:hypothetical protein
MNTSGARDAPVPGARRATCRVIEIKLDDASIHKQGSGWNVPRPPDT